MPTPDINLVAIFLAALANMILGSIWYAPPIFGNLWMQWSGLTEKKMETMKKDGLWKSYLLGFIGTLVMAYVLDHFLFYLEADTMAKASVASVWLWLGFVAPVMLGSYLWEGRPFKLYLLNVSYYLLALIVMSAVLMRVG